MLEREYLYFRILALVPDAKFTMGPDRENTLIKIDGWEVDWYKDNQNPCPTLDQILAVSKEQVDAFIESQRKTFRNVDKAKDLTMVGLYEQAKLSNPNLTFSDYLDSLENISKNM